MSNKIIYKTYNNIICVDKVQLIGFIMYNFHDERLYLAEISNYYYPMNKIQ